jgi:hypothetical protein
MAVCVAAVCAICALAAANASAALPEWGRCVKVPVTIKGKEHKTGKYSNSNCTEAQSRGEYEFVKGTEELPGGTGFTNNLTSEKATLETSFGISVNCTGESATGDLSGTKEVSNVQVTFTGCVASLGNFACENTFKEEEGGEDNFKYIKGEIKTFGLKGKLVYISGQGTSEPKVGLELEPSEPKQWFAFFGCGPGGEHPLPAIKSIVGEKTPGPSGGDKVVSPITPINTMGTETVQKYEIKKVENTETHELSNERGVQEPSEIGGKPAFLETELFIESAEGKGSWGKAAQEETANTKLDSGEELEIKA